MLTPTLQTLQLQFIIPPLQDLDADEVRLQHLALQEVINPNSKEWDTKVYVENGITVIDSKYILKPSEVRVREEKPEEVPPIEEPVEAETITTEEGN